MASSSSPSDAHSYPYPSMLNVSNFVSIKLNENNYELWKAQMLCLVRSQELLGFVDGTIVPPAEKLSVPDDEGSGNGTKEEVRNHHYLLWTRTDQLLKGWILGSLSENVLKNVIALDTARDVWLKLEDSYSQKPQQKPQLQSSVSAKVDNEERHSLTEVEGTEKDYCWYLALYRAALTGDWKSAERFFSNDKDAIQARINYNLEITLHVAVGTGRAIHFVEQLVDSMPNEALALRDHIGDTALNIAAMVGNTKAASILGRRSPDLLYISNNVGSFPLHTAAQYAHRETLLYLLSITKDNVEPSPYANEAGVKLLNDIIEAEFFDVALDLVEKFPTLARLKLTNGNSALKKLAEKDSAFPSSCRFSMLQRLIYSSVPTGPRLSVLQATPKVGDIEDLSNKAQPRKHTCGLFLSVFQALRKLQAMLWEVIGTFVPQVKHIRDKKLMHDQALKLAKSLCEKMECLTDEEASSIYIDAVLLAATYGIHEIVEAIVQTFPTAVHSHNVDTNFNIFHLAVINRCENVYNLIYQMSDHKHRFSDLTDSSRNNLLHLSARLAPPHKLNLVSGAALQMQREIQWYKEVEKFVLPYCKDWENRAGKTPRTVFTEEHKHLKADGEKWMKDTANSCTIAAALIATVVFAAAITVPGGSRGDGFPIFSTEKVFIIFAISDAVSLFTSSTSLLMFLSILTARYAEEDFLYALPKRLIIGLLTLFLSITFMMLAFSATVYLVLGKKNAWVLIPVAALACLPITSFVLLQFPLLVDVISSTYGRGIFGKKSNQQFH